MSGPGHAPDTLPALLHTSPPPGTAKARGAAWVGVGAFCALTVCWDFFPGQHSPPFPLESLVVSLEDGKRLLRRLQTFFFPLLASFSSKKKKPTTNKKTSKFPKGLAERRHLGLERRERAVHSFALPPPTWPRRSPPPRGLSPASRRGRPGSCRVKLRNVAARNVHADEAGAGRDRGGPGAERMLIARK